MSNLACYHCGRTPELDGDHTCPCPHPDGLCPDHDRAPAHPGVEIDPDDGTN